MAQLRARAGAAGFLVAATTAGIWFRRRRAEPPPNLPGSEPDAPQREEERPSGEAGRIDIVTVVDDLLGTAG
jgi:hypothetical protein